MKRLPFILTMLFLSSCASVTATQSDCMKAYQSFPQQASCIHDKITADRSLRGDPLIQEYVLTAQNLSAQVKAGGITDDEARLRLTQKLNQVRERQMAEQVEESDIYNSANNPYRPSYTDCSRNAANLSCVTY
jgi:hypothetical protein